MQLIFVNWRNIEKKIVVLQVDLSLELKFLTMMWFPGSCLVDIFQMMFWIFFKQEKELAPKEEKFDRSKLEDLLKRRFFFVPAFEIYGGLWDDWFSLNMR